MNMRYSTIEIVTGSCGVQRGPKLGCAEGHWAQMESGSQTLLCRSVPCHAKFLQEKEK